MAMMSGGSHGAKAQMNVTPMIDVLLVLIVIFMVITPLTPKGIHALVPQPGDVRSVKPAREMVISIDRARGVRLNQEPVEMDRLSERLASLARLGVADHIFIRGDRGLDFRDVVAVLDIARGAGWERVGLMTQ